MSRKIPVVTDKEFEMLVKTLDAGIRAVGIDCVIDLAPVLIKISQAEHVDDSPAPEKKRATKKPTKLAADNNK